MATAYWKSLAYDPHPNLGVFAWLQHIPDACFTYAILLTSFTTCVIVSLLTPPVEARVIEDFYRKVRPFGLWRNAGIDKTAGSRLAGTPKDTSATRFDKPFSY